jgi:hypothetical protein
MLLLHYRVDPERSAQTPQRWRTVELDPAAFPNLDLTTPQGISAAIRRINDGKNPGVPSFPYGTSIYLTDTDAADHWDLGLTITKAT